ncbi:hypothetical protein UK23_33370 [Lentzea aerocolonigenes]|uniref:Uncharacterized protein n=1 Tax=Lentzea aerocolonigenes TaxID=68170 RepID=A0A0F0GLK3_LENAE|nr:hypothetical protein [Lentzea aerocolonigenes]KJK43411.1 hypothetical protein UK23_33370 [Lentzea aerocolonigenes]
MALTEQRSRPPLGNFARTLRIAVRCVDADLRLATDLRAAVADPPSTTALLTQVEPPLVFARLFAVVTAAAAGGSPHNAMPVSVLSSLWWAGLETSTGAAAARLPLRYLRSLDITEDLRRGWTTDLEETAVDPGPGSSVRSNAYARDAFMAARTCAPSDGPQWREFGRLYGSLADQAAANSAGGAHTPPLLLASACKIASTHRRQHMIRLGEEAGRNAEAGIALRDLSSAPDAVQLYDREVHDLHSRAVSTLAGLCEPNPYRAFLRSRLDGLLQNSLVRPREMVGEL